MELKGLIVLIAYAIGINLLLVSYANINVGISCPSLSKFVNITSTTNQTEVTKQSVELIDIAKNRCDGLPSWIFWIVEIPVIIGLAYIIRAFVGFT